MKFNFPVKKFSKETMREKILKKFISGELRVNIFGGSLNGFSNKFPNGFPQKFQTEGPIVVLKGPTVVAEGCSPAGV